MNTPMNTPLTPPRLELMKTIEIDVGETMKKEDRTGIDEHDSVWRMLLGQEDTGLERRMTEVLDNEDIAPIDDISDSELDYPNKKPRYADEWNLNADAFRKVQLEQMKQQDVILLDDDDIDEEAEAHKRALVRPAEAQEVEVPVTGKGKQVMNYCFTYNNPTVTGEEFKTFLEGQPKVKGFVFQLEEGENAVPHFQGYVQFEKKVWTTAAQTLMHPHRMSLLHAKGTLKANVKYCTKDESRKDGPWMYGTCEDPKGGQGKRCDLDDFARAVTTAGSITDEIKEQFHGHVMRFGHHAKQMLADEAVKQAKAEQAKFWREQFLKKEAGEAWKGQQQRHCVFLFGPTAVGKTTHVMMETVGRLEEDLYTKDGNNKWFDGYQGEENVLFDEMRRDAFGGRIEAFNAMTNHGVVQVEIKGSTTILKANKLWFTANKHPLDIWDVEWRDAKYRAFLRRFAEVHWWNDEKNLIVLKNPGPEEDTEDWKKKNSDWLSFWKGKAVPVEDFPGPIQVEQHGLYFTFGCNH